MSDIFIDKRLYVENSKIPGAKYGVFSKAFIPAGSRVEVARALQMSNRCIFQKENVLADYVFNFGDDTCLLAFGFGSLYNHSDKPQVSYSVTEDKIYYTAVKDIYPGDEVFVSYGMNWWASRGKQAQ